MIDPRRRTLLGATVALFGGGLPVIAQAFQPGAASHPRSRQDGERDDTARVQEMLDRGEAVMLAVGGGGGERGAWLFDRLQLRAGSRLKGEGSSTLVRPTRADTVCAIEADSGSTDQQLADIDIRDFTLRGYVREAGFHEFYHLVILAGVRSVAINGLVFEGFRGDGLLIAGRTWARARIEERRNVDIAVERCTFDGLTRDNRNAISVTGCDRVMIACCTFRRCTRATMPGAVTFETDPGALFSFTSARVTDCSFEACGGNVAQISITAHATAPPPVDIAIRRNTIVGSVDSGADIAVAIAVRSSGRVGEPTNSRIVIAANRGWGGTAPFRLFSGRGICLAGNEWRAYREMALIGFSVPGNACAEVSCSDRFERCGWLANRALGLFNVTGVTLDGTRFLDCGDGSATSAALFLGDGTVSGLTMTGVVMDSPRGTTRIAIERARQNRLEGLRIDAATALAGLLNQAGGR